MGWTWSSRAHGLSHAEFFRDEFGEGVLDAAGGSRSMRNVYVAFRLKDGPVTAIAIVTAWKPDSVYNFGYKEMAESEGPDICDCPEKIFRQLSPLEEVFPGADFEAEGGPRWAKVWRARVQAFHQSMRDRPRLAVGMKVKLPYSLTTIRAHEVFEVRNVQRRIFGCGTYMFRLPRYVLNDLVVVGEEGDG